jgi:fatty acid desaturase
MLTVQSALEHYNTLKKDRKLQSEEQTIEKTTNLALGAVIAIIVIYLVLICWSLYCIIRYWSSMSLIVKILCVLLFLSSNPFGYIFCIIMAYASSASSASKSN